MMNKPKTRMFRRGILAVSILLAVGAFAQKRQVMLVRGVAVAGGAPTLSSELA